MDKAHDIERAERRKIDKRLVEVDDWAGRTVARAKMYEPWDLDGHVVSYLLIVEFTDESLSVIATSSTQDRPEFMAVLDSGNMLSLAELRKTGRIREAIMSRTTLKIPLECSLIRCVFCHREIVLLFALRNETGELTGEYWEQSSMKFCPYCGNAQERRKIRVQAAKTSVLDELEEY